MQYFSKRSSRNGAFGLFILVLFILLEFSKLGTALAEPTSLTDNLSTNSYNSFLKLWSRNDSPVSTGVTARSWLWGPTPFKVGSESYINSPGGNRAVAYWDKSRMEINDPTADTNSQWYITNGLLVRELVSGKMQLGDNSFQDANPATVSIAGDPAEGNPDAPSYASFSKVASLNNDHQTTKALGTPLTSTINKAGNLSSDASLSRFGIKNGYYDTTLGHNIPDVFINYFNSNGTILDNNALKTASLVNWIFAAGFPLTEAYWANVKVGGKVMPVLIQLFERRVLTYNPANAPAWRVEMGNVGQHYYSWRYTQPPVVPPLPVTLPPPSPVVVAPVSSSFVNFSDVASGEKVLEIGNDNLKRTVVFGKQNGAYTSSMLNRQTGQEYLGEAGPEFSLELSSELTGQNVTTRLAADSFHPADFRVLISTQAESVAQVLFQGEFQGSPINLSVYYQVLTGQNFVRKWLTIDPFNASGWVIKSVTLEDWKPTSQLQPLRPAARYSDTYSSGQPNYGYSVEKNAVDTSDPDKRFEAANDSTSVGVHSNQREGFYFFDESLFGQEHFNAESGLRVGNTDFVEPANAFSSGRSVFGVWQGTPDIGFKRFNEYLYNNYAVVKAKRDPVWFSTWYPYESGIYENLLLDTVDRMQSAGFYDMLHIDAGWQSGAPLSVNTERFPNGLDPIIGKLKADGKTLGLWINPFSRSYESLEGYSDFANSNPAWVDNSDPKKRFCPLSGAGDYIRNRLLDIARNWPLDEIYWDGADWNISNCLSDERGWRTPDEEYHNMIKFYAGILRDLHAIRPNLRVNIWSSPPDIHWLSVADQVQLSDIDEPPVLTSELLRRQQMYYATFNMPYPTIWGDWYGISYKRSWSDGLGLPLDIIKYATVSVIGNGAIQAGGSLDLANTPPAVIQFLNQLFSWRKQYADYFNVYQHVLGFPDGMNIDGEAHLINGKGFILLFNPTNTAKQVDLPLSEPELELKAGVYYNISNWTELSNGVSLGQARPGDKMTLTIPGYGYKIIGINM